MSRADDVRPAPETVSSRSKCISCRMSMCRARYAVASATTARPWRSSTRARAIYDVLNMTVEEAVTVL